MRRLDFEKYEGLGNDFVIVRSEMPELSAETVTQLCDRHRGVGADGVLTLSPPAGSGVVKMVVQNADGSRPEMCGNGLRCVALYLTRQPLAPSKTFLVETDAGSRLCEVREPGAQGKPGASRYGNGKSAPRT